MCSQIYIISVRKAGPSTQTLKSYQNTTHFNIACMSFNIAFMETCVVKGGDCVKNDSSNTGFVFPQTLRHTLRLLVFQRNQIMMEAKTGKNSFLFEDWLIVLTPL